VTIQSSKDDIIDTIGLGIMGGFRVKDGSAFNLGIGAILDPSAKYLPPGYEDGKQPPVGYVPGDKLPNGATSIVLVTKSKVGCVLLASFTF
jgi:hypothetical protein